MLYDRLGQNIGRGRSKNHYYKDCFKLVKKFQRKFIIFYAIWKLIFHYRIHSLTNRNKIKKTFVDYLLYLIPKKSGSNCPRVLVYYKSNTTSAKCGTGTAQPFEESKFTTGFQIGSCRSIFNFVYVMSCVTLLILLSLFLQTLRCLSIELRSLITTLISSNFFSQKIIFSIFLIRNLNYSGCLFYHFCNVLFQLVYLILYMLDSIRP